jgi:putative SOS response-associated peptidase YedK
MCGRFTLRTPARDLVEVFELLREPELSPRYNIAPTQNVAVILPEENFAQWLDPKNENLPELEALLRPYAPSEMTAFPISTLVNSPRNERSECILPASISA